MMRRDALRISLERHAPSDATEERHRRRMLELLGVQGDPFCRDHYLPGHFTASAFVVDASGRHLLLVHHEKLRRWLQPGGHVDPSDPDLVAAARREVREETGLTDLILVGDGPLDLDVHAIPARPDTPAHEHFDVRFLFRVRDRVGDGLHRFPDPSPPHPLRAGSDALEARWAPLDTLEPPGWDASVLRATRRIRAILGRSATTP